MLGNLDDYALWLRDEAIAGGGIGPGETERIPTRHIADSLLFAGQIPPTSSTVWDLGSGVGLPGIPLAITNPAVEFHLIDRSGRRTDLLRRAIRILELDNCVVRKTEISRLDGEVGVIVSRATLPAGQMLEVGRRLLSSGGIAIVGGSWQDRPEHVGWETIEIPPEVLDQTIWLLIMRRA